MSPAHTHIHTHSWLKVGDGKLLSVENESDEVLDDMFECHFVIETVW